jgi:uncharacterized protein YijF (DUF1287 family)
MVGYLTRLRITQTNLTYHWRVNKPFQTLAFASLSFFCLASQSAAQSTGADLVAAALKRTESTVRYDGSYRSIPYPNGDVPKNTGVCTDVIIRSYRAIGIDLQRRVHEDMRVAFSKYPKNWGLKRPDRNIDHRRVPNLRRYFERHGQSLPVSRQASQYKPGDIVSWMLPGNLPHIGIVTDQISADGKRPKIVHNISAGPKLDDMLFDYPITGHYRYVGHR